MKTPCKTEDDCPKRDAKKPRQSGSERRLVVPSGSDVLAKREPYTADDLIDAVLACAEEERQARLSGLENGFDHPNACVLFGFAKGIAISLRHNAEVSHGDGSATPRSLRP